jgi:dipeptidyl aminopeptidase/acylaminoacyl peptidase
MHVASDRNPGDYYLFNLKAKNASMLISQRDWINPERMATTRGFHFTARDGLRIDGLLTLPPGSDGKNLPMVVNPHGGPFGIQDVWGYSGEVQLLANAGYAVLQVNYRGSGGFGEAFEHAGYKQWGRAMQDDLTDATRWAIQQGIADSKRICIYGASYGGYASLEGVAKEPDLYRCAVGYVGVYDMPMMYHDGDIPERLFGRNFLKETLGEDKLEEISPDMHADRIKAPVLLTAGGADERAPIEQSKRMEQALRNAGKPVETLYYPEEAHGFYKMEHRQELYTRLLAFLRANIGPGIGPGLAPATPAATAVKPH